MLKSSRIILEAKNDVQRFDERLFALAQKKEKESKNSNQSTSPSDTPLADSIIINKRGVNTQMYFTKSHNQQSHDLKLLNDAQKKLNKREKTQKAFWSSKNKKVQPLKKSEYLLYK